MTDFHDKMKVFYKKITANKTKRLEVEIKLTDLKIKVAQISRKR